MKRLLVLLVTCHLSLFTAFAQGTPGTVRYPTNLDTLDSLIRIKDTRAVTTLSSAMTASSTTAAVPTGGTGKFDATGAIQIDDEIMYYSSKTSTGFAGPLVRGACGTTAKTHPAGTAIRSPLTACHHNVLAESIVATQTKLNSAVIGPSSSTLHALGAFADTTGKLLENTPATINSLGEILDSPTHTRNTSGTYLTARPHVNLTANSGFIQGAWIDPFLSGSGTSEVLIGARLDGTYEGSGTLARMIGVMANPLVDNAGASTATAGDLTAFQSAPDFEGLAVTNVYGLYHNAILGRTGGTFTNHYGVRLTNPIVFDGTLINNYGLYVDYYSAGSTLNYNIYSAGATSKNKFEGTVDIATLNLTTGGSTTISTGVGSIKMSSANPADNTAWIPIKYAGTTYYVPGWPTNAP